ncbi:methyltransferase domain-containing protein [Primorskyibacter sp. 2E233]|uniref:methyltransferase domain-containing protein n=1 Tax=Primorskyibacter sp. 2E233 TaxID=3413431 RepID=UPI003BF1DAD9
MSSTAQTTTGFAERYQSILVPVIFEPWARELIRRADPQAGEHILDLGCGTGVVTRQVAALNLPLGSLTSVDHSQEMLDVARRLSKDSGLNAEWIQADASALPFKNEMFELAFCQQALQFFPDRPAALHELHRVLKPDGRVVCCVQGALDVNPMLLAQAKALDEFVGPTAGDAVRAICSLPDAHTLRDLFEEAGFHKVRVEPVTLDLQHPDARAFAVGAMGGMHTGDKLSGLAQANIDGATDAFLTGLGPCFDGIGMQFPHLSHVVQART